MSNKRKVEVEEIRLVRDVPMVFDYMCRECGEGFDEPHRYTERHGFNYGPGEEWAVCPNCGSCDWAEASVVEAELAEVDEDDLLEDQGWVDDEEVDEVDTLSV